MRHYAIWLILGLAACRGPMTVENDAHYENMPSWLSDSNLTERVTSATDVAARQWGGSPSDLDGWTIELTSGVVTECNGQKASDTGCAEWSGSGGGVMQVYPGERLCIELTILAHEVGHAIIHDGNHDDPRWCDPKFWYDMEEALGDEAEAVEPGGWCSKLLHQHNNVLGMWSMSCK